eukprot:gnl/Spiro4/17879_TR9520_c0_g2_i1.p9 gnl/Spiro4/17879_TR9520_c0_g2~~gnl/Spiro4/17879_TR9520_c0_g2_i1.p9  ORF type:complete len:244 (+),score=42.31 gnl/Spiro4/17879_TR9520_c0_g2_i1:16091-16822(+)
MSELREIFDELSKSSDKWEPYFEIYDNHVPRVMTQANEESRDLVLVEVGVQKGGSLDMWSRYLNDENECCQRMLGTKSETISIYGIDIDPACKDLKYDDPNIKVVIGDQGDPAFWDKFLTEHPKIDIFIDDGGHYMQQQILTFEKVFPHINVGGVYICEDCHTSYMQANGGGLNRRGTFIEYAKGYVDVLHYDWKEEMTSDLEAKYKIGKGLSGLCFYDSVVVFEKTGKKEMKRVFPNLFPNQ